MVYIKNRDHFKKGWYNDFWVFLVIILFLTGVSSLNYVFAAAAEPLKFQIVILVSQEIRPYMEAIEGLKESFKTNKCEQVKVIYPEIKNENEIYFNFLNDIDVSNVYVAIGPEAMRHIWEDPQFVGKKRYYLMVLNPQNIVPNMGDACGIALNIPVKTQLEITKISLPSIKKVGILYDPFHNAGFAEAAFNQASNLSLSVVPLQVTAKHEISDLLTESWSKVDCLWLIPDQTIISESIIQYIIRQAIDRNVPVVGYNRFFYTNGAALSFIINYHDTGKKAGDMIFQLLKNGECQSSEPVFHAWYNLKICNQMDIIPIENRSMGIEAGP